MFALLICTATLNSSPKPETKMKDPFHLIVEGKFLNQKNITYTVYKMDSRGIFVKESRTKGKRYFSITCDVQCKYIIRFEDRNRNVKFLMVDAAKGGYFNVDVDFSRKHDAILQLTKVGYSLIPLTANLMVKN